MVCGNFDIVKHQLLATISANIVLFSQGCNIGWFSPVLPLLMSNTTPLEDGPISSDMAGWIGSFLSFGALFGCFIFFFISNYIGNKRSILLCSIPLTISWLIVIFGTTAWQLCLSRFFCGLAYGGAMGLIPLFIAEIASDFIRGELNSYLHVSGFSGILCGYIGGSYLPYETCPLIMIIFPMLFLCSFGLMPDSPQYLLLNNKLNASNYAHNHLHSIEQTIPLQLAEKSLRFYRNCSKGNTDKEQELQEELQKLMAIARQRETAEKLQFSEFGSSTTLRALLIGPFLSAVSLFSGAFGISTYAVLVFQQTSSTINPNVSAIVLGVLQTFGTYTASQLIDRVGRKTLLLISMSGGFVTLLGTGTFLYLEKNGFDMSSFRIFPVISISFYVFICVSGVMPVPFVMVSELLPQRIRRVGATFYTASLCILQFVFLKIFPVILYALGLDGSLFLFAGVLVVGFIFTIFVVRETKGINLDVLEATDLTTSKALLEK